MGRSDAFEDEAVTSLRNLGYSEDEIGRTAGDPSIAGLGTEERLRVSLRALSDEHSRKVQEPFENERLAKSGEEEANNAYNEGRKSGEREALKRMSQSQKEAKARTPRAPRPKSAATQRREAMSSVRTLSHLARLAKGKRR